MFLQGRYWTKEELEVVLNERSNASKEINKWIMRYEAAERSRRVTEKHYARLHQALHDIKGYVNGRTYEEDIL